MKLFKNIFGKQSKLTGIDTDFGEMHISNSRGNSVTWMFKYQFLNSDIMIFIHGNRQGIYPSQKQILLSALDNETLIKSEAEKALKNELANADISFISIEQQFTVTSISVYDDGFELGFREKESPFYYFNVHFKNNQQEGVSIDG